MATEVDKESVKDAKVRTSAVEFYTQVRQEVSKVTWPSRKETMITAMMVFIMVVIAMLFFGVVDGILAWGMQLVLRQG